MRWIANILIILCALNSMAQDPQFTQFYAAPIYLNPGFAGNTTQARATINYRNQWPAMPGKFISYAAAFDYNLDALNSGFAVALQQDRAGTAALRSSNIALHYSYTLRVSRKLALKPGVYFSYTFRNVDQTDLVFGDQLIYDNPVSNSNQSFSAEPVRYPDLGTGLVGYMKNWWAGMAFHHLNRPNQSLIEGEARLPMRFSMHGGYNFVISQNVKKQQISSVTAVAHYKAQGKWDQVDIGAYYRYKIITAGFYYRGLPLFKNNTYAQPNHDAIAALIGFQYKDLAFGYSYDLTISKLITDSGGSHEISLKWEIASEKKKRKRRRSKFLIPCAKF
ncbi:MAG: PorP/SprF family type IX secretion system membrane protein [Flavobacteriales bacterium]|nr:PorP/SprF family type IX secretion system membrane protein [Flavobacteriales bacterium]